MVVPVGLGIRVPDVAETLDRAEAWRANRLAQLVNQRALAQREALGTALAQHGGALFSGDPTRQMTALEALVRGGGPEALPIAMPFWQAARQPNPTRERNVGAQVVTEEFDPATRTWRAIGTAPRWQPQMGGAGGMDPATVREWQFFNSLSPEDQRRYLLLKRAQTALDLGDQRVIVDPANPAAAPLAAFPRGLPPQRVVDGGTETVLPSVPGAETRPPEGQTSGQMEPRVRDLPLTAEERAKAAQAATTATQTLRVIDGIVNHPALSAATGPLAWTQAIPGSPMYDFGTRVAQLQGRAFLQAFETLKGGGQITEVEGRKATDAIARLQSGMSPADVRAALGELREVVLTAQRRAALRARGQREAPPEPEPDVPSETPRVRRYNPQTGQLE